MTTIPNIKGVIIAASVALASSAGLAILARVSEDLGVRVEFRTTKDIPTFEACLAAGIYDFAYMNPVHYTIFSESGGYDAVARQSDKKLRGLLVVSQDSDIASIQDLEGANIAFPSSGAFGASVVPRAELRARGISFSPEYVRSHDSVYRAVAAGLMPAGGGVQRTFGAIEEELRAQLRVVYSTDGYTPHAIAAHDTVPVEIRAALLSILLDISTNAPDLAASIGMNGFERALDDDWDDVRSLGLTAQDTGILTEGDSECPSG